MTRALLEQALDALEDCDTAIKHLMQPAHPEVQITKTSATDVMKAIRAHLAQPQGEPVAWINPAGTYAEASTSSTVYGSHTIPLYIHPAHTEADIDAARDCCV